MEKDKLVFLAAQPTDELMRLTKSELHSRASFTSHIENADNPRLHLFVASNVWKELIVQMKDTEALNCLKYMLPKFEKITVFLFGEVTLRMVQTLGELYPDKASALRRAYMSGEDIGRLLNG